MSKKILKKSELYDKGNYNYKKYWEQRSYEHAAEEMAIRRLLKGMYFKRAADIGGGYGRLCVVLEDYADEVVLAEPAESQLKLAREFLKGHKRVKIQKMQADKLGFDDQSVNLLTMIRVMHHLPDPSKEFRELARVMADDGQMILEIANYTHVRNRLKHLIKREKMPIKPVDIRSEHNKRSDEVEFVNHNPKTVIKQLAHAGLRVDRTLSVSNLRSPAVKKFLPAKLMLAVESVMQPSLAKTYFGPSVFFLVKKQRS